MNILIIEDEIPAQQILIKMLGRFFPDFRICGVLDSIKAASAFLKENSPDMILMDVELSDGKCFTLFGLAEIKCPVIITTAYADYALDAFKAKCIDYLLKPIDPQAFKQAVERCIQLCVKEPAEKPAHDINSYARPAYKHHFAIKLGSQIVVVDVNDIAYFYSNDKSTWLVTRDGKQYMTDESLISIEDEIDPARFYKISRKCIVGMSAIYTISKYFNSRLKVTLSPKNIDPVIVPRDRVQSFLDWLEGA